MQFFQEQEIMKQKNHLMIIIDSVLETEASDSETIISY